MRLAIRVAEALHDCKTGDAAAITEHEVAGRGLGDLRQMLLLLPASDQPLEPRPAFECHHLLDISADAISNMPSLYRSLPIAVNFATQALRRAGGGRG